MPDSTLRLRRIEAFVFRCALEEPVRTSFGTMRDRPALLVRVEDAHGVHGWGEVWCNWPACGAEHRAALLVEDIAELVLDQPLDGPAQAWEHVTARTAVKALQTGEPGPYAQAIAGLDIALWDLAGRVAGQPVARLLAPGCDLRIGTYASGIDSRAAATVIPSARAAGFTAFKVKIGFPQADDLALAEAAFAQLEPGETLAADVNQGWTPDQAMAFAAAARGLPLAWLEEPLRVDADPADWHRLADALPVPLAGGENLIGRPAFDAAIRDGILGVIQPDAAKWGGISGCHAVAAAARKAGRRYCPHYLGGGIGLAASAHLLAAAGGDGLLEIDVNPNPLRTALVPSWPAPVDGQLSVPDRPGLGFEPDLTAPAEFRVRHLVGGEG